jgi:basic amino acid/polyamine antiporter, APA family
MLSRRLGFAAVTAVVIGDMIGSGIFYTPGELASIANNSWHVYFLWTLSGLIVLCGTLTLAELGALLPETGAMYHIIGEGFGRFWGFLNVWMQMWVAGPGSVAGIAVLFGTFASQLFGWTRVGWGIGAILFFTGLNLLGVQWGGRTQVGITAVKITALLALVAGGLIASPPPADNASSQNIFDLSVFIKFVGLGIATVLFTYDGWIDATHVAGEVENPERNLPTGLILGVVTVIVLYLLVNFVFLRLVPLESMRQQPSRVASMVATDAFGHDGARFVSALIAISIFGSMGGFIMTLPRLFYAGMADAAKIKPNVFLAGLTFISRGTAVPAGSICFCAITSIVALVFFQSFSSIVNFFVVPLSAANLLMVISIFPLRRRYPERKAGYRTPGYPVVPLIYAIVMFLFILSALVYKPVEALYGIALTATGVPVYLWLKK